jgi:hypothetical protein
MSANLAVGRAGCARAPGVARHGGLAARLARLGGTAGIGTVAYALTIGPLTHLLLPRLTITTPPGTKGVRDQ